jgi:nitrogenase subunit NifH
MPQIITFLGKGGSGRTTMSTAAARQLASVGQRVLWVGQSAYYTPELWNGATLSLNRLPPT